MRLEKSAQNICGAQVETIAKDCPHICALGWL
jgi:hypothetical protein